MAKKPAKKPAKKTTKKPGKKPAKKKAEEGEDFIGKLKKLKADSKSPSIIADTLEKLEALEKENLDLKEKLEENTDNLKKTTKEKEDLGSKLSMKADDVAELKRDNYQLSTENKALRTKMEEIEVAGKEGDLSKASAITKSLVEDLQKKLTIKKKQVSQLQTKVSNLESQLNDISEGKAPSQSEVKIEPPKITEGAPESEQPTSIDKGLLDNLSSELSKKKTQVRDMQLKIKNLTEEKESLNDQLEEIKRRQSGDFVAPVEESSKPVEKAVTSESESRTLDILIQDLQSDLNKYKKVIVKLKKENAELKSAGGAPAPVDTGETKQLKAENETLKAEIVNLEKKLMVKAKETPATGDSDDKIQELENEIDERDKIIKELKASRTAEVESSGAVPMTGLVDDLQSKINKLKAALKEKNKVIEELKKSGQLTFKR